MDWSKGCDSVNIPLKSGNKSHKISLFYFKFNKLPNFALKNSLVLKVLFLYFCVGLFLRWDYGRWSASFAFIGSWVLGRVLWGINGANISYTMKYAKCTIISPYTLQNLLILLISLERPWWVPTKACMAHFLGKISPSGDPKKRGLPLLQRMFLYKMAQFTMFWGEKKLNLPRLDHIFRMSWDYYSRVPKYCLLHSLSWKLG
jgi:hypothetical protein